MSPFSKLMGGIFLGAFAVATCMVLLLCAAPVLPYPFFSRKAVLLITAATVGTAVALWRPVALKTVWRDDHPFLLEDEIHAMIVGRLVGVPFGLAAGLYLDGLLFV